MRLAVVFLALNALAITLAPAARQGAEAAPLPWQQWVGLAVWAVVFSFLHRQTMRSLPERDPFILPLGALLSGWGLLTIFRLSTAFAWRQTAWLAVAGIILFIFIRRLPGLSFLRRYKYVWLTGGLALTALTLIFGTNPLGYGPRLWLGCCGVYMQPSEPLKLLLMIYLAAYLADRQLLLHTSNSQSSRVSGWISLSPVLLPILAPSLLMTGFALAIMLIQRDLGTAFIFLFLYAAVIYLGMQKKRILAAGLLGLAVSGAGGYLLFDVVRLRVEAWLNPWVDPSGRSYQIVQSLLAVANGGLLGRGPGMGSPGLVPIAHSDFIFSAIAEESGLLGGLALLVIIGLLAQRGLRAALHAPDLFQRLLAGGLSAYLCGQAILIIGGNLRLLPLTGVTLPFVSYGGSSLVTSFLALLMLLFISNQPEEEHSTLMVTQPYMQLQAFLLAGLAAAALICGWWAIWRSPDMLLRTDNPRRTIADRFVRRGGVYDRKGHALTTSEGQPGSFTRLSHYESLAPVLGYTHPVYGQSGLEASLDAWLRGLQGYPDGRLFWSNLVYGTPPPGLDVRLTIDLDLQRQADELLGQMSGAVVLLDASSGDLLVLASHPAFNPNQLDQDWESLVQDPQAPFVNRASLGQYPPGAALSPLLIAASHQADLEKVNYAAFLASGNCIAENDSVAFSSLWSSCPNLTSMLGEDLGAGLLLETFHSLGFYQVPQVYLPAITTPAPQGFDSPGAAALGIEPELRISPIQMALAAASLSTEGIRPAPRLLLAVNEPEQDWMMQSAVTQAVSVFTPVAARAAAAELADPNQLFWQSAAVASTGEDAGNRQVSWFLSGTLPAWQGSPLVVVVLLEADAPWQAVAIGQTLLHSATYTTP